MTVTGIELREPQDTLTEGETVVSELEDGTRLIKTDDGRGVVRPAPEAAAWERVYDRWADARLFYGLLIEIGGPWSLTPESPRQCVPVEVAAAGKDALAAYLRVGTGSTQTVAGVASTLEVTEQTVSNYCNRIRWSSDE